jgi:hypothetical protein
MINCGLDGSGIRVRFPVGTQFFFSTLALLPTHPVIQWELRTIPRRQSGLGVKLTINLHLCPKVYFYLTILFWGHSATNQKVAGSILDEVSGFLNRPNPSSRAMVLGSTQPLTEMSTRNLPGGKRRPARKADNLTAICEPIVWKMWDPRRLTTLWASIACYITFSTLARQQEEDAKA